MRPVLIHKKRTYNHSVLLTEFRFYNKAKEVIHDTILTDIQLQLEAAPNYSLYWTNDFYAKHKIGFKFYSSSIQEKTANKTKNRIDVYIELIKLDVDFSVEQFNTAEYIFGNFFITCLLTPEQYNAILDIDFFHNKTIETLIIFNTFNEVIDWAIENNTFQLEHIQNFDEINKLCTTVFNHSLTKINTKVIKNNYNDDSTVYFILDVIEKRIHNINYRISIDITFKRFYNPECRIKTYSEKNIEYNNIDKERIYFNAHDKYYFLDLALTFYNTDKQLQINLDIIHEIEKDITRILDEEQTIITPFIYNFYAQRNERKNIYTGNKKEQLLNSINEQYRKLLKQGTTIKIRETLISKKRIEIEKRFYMEFNDEFFDVCDKFYIIKKILDDNEAQYNFNTLYEEILKNSKLGIVNREYTRNNEYKNISNLKYIVNGMEIKISKIGDRMHINDIFSRIDDVYHILSKAICYTDIDSFNTYVEEVSHIGIEWKQLISTGIIITLDNPFYSTLKTIGLPTLERTMMRFSLLWDTQKRNNVYLLLNGHKYLIKYKQKFLRHFNLPNRRITITTLALELKECLVNINDNNILEIINNAIEEAKIVQQRGEELVSNTVKETKALLIKEKIQNNMVEGYLIVGLQTKAEYFIDKINLTVYKKTNGVWNRRCVVDDSRKQRIFEDRLANRLVNIYNEPSYIGTIQNS